MATKNFWTVLSTPGFRYTARYQTPDARVIGYVESDGRPSDGKYSATRPTATDWTFTLGDGMPFEEATALVEAQTKSWSTVESKYRLEKKAQAKMAQKILN